MQLSQQLMPSYTLNTNKICYQQALECSCHSNPCLATLSILVKFVISRPWNAVVIATHRQTCFQYNHSDCNSVGFGMSQQPMLLLLIILKLIKLQQPLECSCHSNTLVDVLSILLKFFIQTIEGFGMQSSKQSKEIVYTFSTLIILSQWDLDYVTSTSTHLYSQYL